MAASDRPLLTLAELAGLARVSVGTVRRWAADGRIPTVQVGPRVVRIKREDALAVLGLAEADRPRRRDRRRADDEFQAAAVAVGL